MKNFFLNNIKLKVIALLLALVAWAYVNVSSSSIRFYVNLRTEEREEIVKVEYENLNDDLQIIKSTDRVELSLIEKLHFSFTKEPIRAYADLEELESPGHYYPQIEVVLPNWMELKDKRPDEALIIVEEVKR